MSYYSVTIANLTNDEQLWFNRIFEDEAYWEDRECSVPPRHEFESDSLRLYHIWSGDEAVYDTDAIAELLQEFLQQFRPADYLAFDSAAEEVKYLGSDIAAGTAYFITADSIDRFSTTEWIRMTEWIRGQSKQFLQIDES